MNFIILFLSLISIREPIQNNLIIAQDLFYEAFDLSSQISIDSIVSLTYEEKKLILSNVSYNNPYKLFILAETDEEIGSIDSFAGNNIFIHFYFYLLSDKQSEKDNQIKWMKDIIMAKGMKGSSYIGNYFFQSAIDESNLNIKEKYFFLAKEFCPDNIKINIGIIKYFFNKKDFSKVFSEVINLFSAFFNTLENRLILSSNILQFISIYLIILICLVSFYFYFKYISEIIHIVYHKIFSYFSFHYSSIIIATFLSMTPLLLFIYPLLIAPLVFGLVFIQLKKGERKLFSILLFSILVLIVLFVELDGKISTFINKSGIIELQNDINYNDGAAFIPDSSTQTIDAFTQAILFRRDNNFIRALKIYKVLEGKIPDDILWNNRGVIYLDINERDSAYKYFTKAVNMNQDIAEIHYNLYLYYLKEYHYHEKAEEERLIVEKYNRSIFSQRGSGKLSILPNPEFSALDISFINNINSINIMSYETSVNQLLTKFIPTPIFKFLIFFIILFTVGVIINLVVMKNKTIQHCSICKKSICDYCIAKKMQLTLCLNCYKNLNRLSGSKSTIVNELAYNALQQKNKFYLIVSLLIPGLSHYLSKDKIKFNYILISTLIISLYFYINLNIYNSNSLFNFKLFLIFSIIYLITGFISYLSFRKFISED